MIVYNKLIRDRIPEILAEKKIEYKIHIADVKEYQQMLYKKLIEELLEFEENPCIEEFADMLEVLETIAKVHKFSINNIKTIKKAKRINRGGFDEKIILETTI